MNIISAICDSFNHKQTSNLHLVVTAKAIQKFIFEDDGINTTDLTVTLIIML